MKIFKIEINDLTSYAIADNQEDALDYYAIDSNYYSYDDLIKEHPLTNSDHMEITESDVFFCEKKRIQTIEHPLSDDYQIGQYLTTCVDDDMNSYDVTWQFEEIKGQRPDIDDLPWDRPEYITSIVITGDA